MAKPRIMFYNDGRHPLIYMYEPPIHKQQYEQAIDELAGTPVEAIMFCLGDGRTMLHDTKVGELWGHNVSTWKHEVFHRAHRNAVHLIDQGEDPLRIVIDRAHEKGMLLYPTLLVQQPIGQRDQDMRCSDFWFDHPHLAIGAKGDLPEDFSGNLCLDFKHDEVRKERLAIIEETLKNYPVDGFELQLNYCPDYFHPDQVQAGRAIMTDWVGQVYDLVKNSGQDRELAIRVPASIEGCHAVGMDVRQWIKQEIVDVLIASTHEKTALIDQMNDLEPLVEAAKGSPCRVHASIHDEVDSDRLSNATTAIMRATACNYWAQDIDGLYLAQWFTSWPYDADFYEKLREIPHPDIMAPKDKHYYLTTTSGRFAQPTLDPGTTMSLPATLHLGKPISVNMAIADDLPYWDKTGRVHEVLLRVRITNINEISKLRFRLNGKELPDKLLRRINGLYRMRAPRYRVGSSYWFIYRLDNQYWPRQGRTNSLEITLLDKDEQVAETDVFVRDVEMEIKYLMGKNFHRGHDADLGPYEYAST